MPADKEHTEAIVNQATLQAETNLKLDTLIDLHKDLLSNQATKELVGHLEKHIDTQFEAMERAHMSRILVWGIGCGFVFLAFHGISEVLDHIAEYEDITGKDFINFVNLSGGAVLTGAGAAGGWLLKHFKVMKVNGGK